MPLNAGDVKITYQRQTWGLDAMANRVQVYEIGFTVRGQGNYTVTVPIEGFTAAKAEAAIKPIAEQVVNTLDLFK